MPVLNFWNKTLAKSLAALILFGFSVVTVHAQSNKEDLIKACVKDQLSSLQMSSSQVESFVSPGVTCPAADVVGFPPKERKHNRSGEIRLAMPEGRTLCPGTIPQLLNVSDNGGGHGNFSGQ